MRDSPKWRENVADRLGGVQEIGGCIRELHDVTVELDRQGFVGRPAWVELELGTRPPPANVIEPGEWAHGWQYFASSVSEYHFRESTVFASVMSQLPSPLAITLVVDLPTCCKDAPQNQSSQFEPELFRTVILGVVDAVCECGGPHRHQGTPQGRLSTFRLRTRAVAPERTLARICREAGATVRSNIKLRDMNVHVRADDERCIEVLAGLCSMELNWQWISPCAR